VNGFRYEWEPIDARPVLIYTYPFWKDRVEQAIYEAAVAGNPRLAGEGALTYAARISAIVTAEQ
jgi:hypothetical protein